MMRKPNNYFLDCSLASCIIYQDYDHLLSGIICYINLSFEGVFTWSLELMWLGYGFCMVIK